MATNTMVTMNRRCGTSYSMKAAWSRGQAASRTKMLSPRTARKSGTYFIASTPSTANPMTQGTLELPKMRSASAMFATSTRNQTTPPPNSTNEATGDRGRPLRVAVTRERLGNSREPRRARKRPGSSVARKSDMRNLGCTDRNVRRRSSQPKQIASGHRAVQRAGRGPIDPNRHQFAGQARAAVEMHRAVSAGAAHPAQPLLVRALDQDLLDGAHEQLVPAPRVLLQQTQQDLIAHLLDLLRHLAGQSGGGRARADGILEDVGHVVIHRLEELAGLREVLLGLAGKTDDDIGREMHVRADPAQIVDDLPVAFAGVGPVHGPEDAVAARLQRQVHVATQFGQPAVRLDQ